MALPSTAFNSKSLNCLLPSLCSHYWPVYSVDSNIIKTNFTILFSVHQAIFTVIRNPYINMCLLMVALGVWTGGDCSNGFGEGQRLCIKHDRIFRGVHSMTSHISMWAINYKQIAMISRTALRTPCILTHQPDLHPQTLTDLVTYGAYHGGDMTVQKSQACRDS